MEIWKIVIVTSEKFSIFHIMGTLIAIEEFQLLLYLRHVIWIMTISLGNESNGLEQVLLKNANKLWVLEMALGFDKLEPLAYLKHETEEMTFGKRKKKNISLPTNIKIY